MTFLIIFAAKYLIALSVLLLLWEFWRMRRTHGFQFFVITIGTFVLAYALAKISGHFYIDPRPFTESGIAPLIPHAADNGFPSDHALLAAAIAAIGTLFSLRYGITLWIIAILIGIGRVAAGVHHPIDIVGSFFFAALSAWLLAYAWSFRWRDEQSLNS